MVRHGFAIFSKLFLIFPLTFLLKTDAELVEISTKLLQKCSEDIRRILPLETLMIGDMKKLFVANEAKNRKTFKSKRSLSGIETWGKRESPRPRPLRHGKRSDTLTMDRKSKLLASMWEHRDQFEKGWKSVPGLFI